MTLTTDTIDKAKALIGKGVKAFEDYQDGLSPIPAFRVMMGVNSSP
jgi:hypothetical protein